MVTLRELSSELGSDLVPASGGAPSSRPLTGIHLSELQDPTPYLDGGELLLTTGMPLGDETSIAEYVARLQAIGVHALGFGVGAWLADIPAGLREACLDADVELMLVPDKVPFQRVSRAFWKLEARTEKADLMDSLDTQTALARAAMRADATSAVVRGLAQELQGWAAYLPVDESPDTFWPEHVEPLLPRLRAETLRLNRSGVHSAATFEIDGRPVAEYPIADGAHILGFLAIGPNQRITAANRQVVLTACTLLAMQARERQSAANTTRALSASAAKLLLNGQAEAARSVLEDMGSEDLPARVRILAIQGHEQHANSDTLVAQAAQLPRSADVTSQELGECLLSHCESALRYLVLAPPDSRRRSVPSPAEDASETSPLKAALSDPVPLSRAADVVPRLRMALSQARKGTLVGTADQGQARAEEWVVALADHPSPDLLGTVAAYLRHRGHWEKASRDLRLHRNSLRHRISIATSILDADLDDADVAATLWLALRRHQQ